MFRTLVIAFFFTLFFAPYHSASAKTGNTLYEDCKVGASADPLRYGRCVGYLEGALDSFNMDRFLQGKPRCVPDEITLGQLRDIVVKKLAGEPQQRHYSAIVLSHGALNSAFPACSPLNPLQE